MTRRPGMILMLLGAALMAAAVLLLGHNRLEDARAGRASESVLRQLQTGIAGADGNNGAEQSREAPTGEYLGILSVPALKLELPVRAEWSYPALRVSPCRYFGSPEGQDLVVVGHNYSGHFGRLRELQTGDFVLFTDREGIKTVYAVEQVLTLLPTAVRETLESGYALTLVTCTPGGAGRIAVQCTAVGCARPQMKEEEW